MVYRQWTIDFHYELSSIVHKLSSIVKPIFLIKKIKVQTTQNNKIRLMA
jgi:hypothetical protein